MERCQGRPGKAATHEPAPVKTGRRALALAASLAASCLILLPAPARAEPDARTFLEKIDKGEKIYLTVLNGYGVGLGWANTYVAEQGQPKIFCPPDKLAITAEQNVEILRRFVAVDPSIATAPAGMAMLFAYRSEFPCPGDQDGAAPRIR
jgi:hypothetical protein